MLRPCSCRTNVLSAFIRIVADVQIRAVSTAARSLPSRPPRDASKPRPQKWTPPVRPGDAQRDPDKKKAYPFGRRAVTPPKSKEKKPAAAKSTRSLVGRPTVGDRDGALKVGPRSPKPIREEREDTGDAATRPLPSARRLRRATIAKPGVGSGPAAQEPPGDEDVIISALLQDAEKGPEPKKEEWWKTGHSPNLPAWAVRKNKMREAGMLSGEGWNPRKKVSPDSLNGIRALHASDPETFSPRVLAAHFGLSYESIYRILHSKWQPSEKEREDMRQRWETRVKKKTQQRERQRFRKNSARIINSILHPAFEPGIKGGRRRRISEANTEGFVDAENAFLRRPRKST